MCIYFVNFLSAILFTLQFSFCLCDNDTIEIQSHISDDPNDVHIWFHPDPNEPEKIKVELRLDGKFEIPPKKKTVILIHGFQGSATTSMPVVPRDAYLRARLPYNIITIGWGKLSGPQPRNSGNLLEAYLIVVSRSIPIVANKIAIFLQIAVDNNWLTYQQVHFVGHSIGAHIAGQIGKRIRNSGRGSIGRITGLDPAGPEFENNRGASLTKNDAEFVDVYHSAIGTLGIRRRSGHADIYIHDGHKSKGCGLDILGRCSHAFAWEWFSTTISGKIRDAACPCKPKFVEPKLIFPAKCGGPCNSIQYAGEYLSRKASGDYQVNPPPHPLVNLESNVYAKSANLMAPIPNNSTNQL